MTNKKAVVLLSGGMDSAVALAVAINQGYEVHAMSFDYGQKHKWELDCARRLVNKLKVEEHKVIKLDLSFLTGSALIGNGEIPTGRTVEQMIEKIPVTYVPVRNLIFLSLALSWAESLGAADIFIGVYKMPDFGYPDCREAFIQGFENLANIATKLGLEDKRHISIRTPLQGFAKSEALKLGLDLGVDFEMTSSCFNPSPYGKPCRICDACIVRQQAFKELGVVDPLDYYLS